MPIVYQVRYTFNYPSVLKTFQITGFWVYKNGDRWVFKNSKNCPTLVSTISTKCRQKKSFKLSIA
jgi:hypothetical protein